MSLSNRRRKRRIRIDRSVKVPIQIHPVLPFLGEPVEANLVNLSAEGMAFSYPSHQTDTQLRSGMEIKAHFRLPGLPLEECRGVVSHAFEAKSGTRVIGIRFSKSSAEVMKVVDQMADHDEACDRRFQESADAWCIPNCAFFSLCRKPIRLDDGNLPAPDELEISLEVHG